MQNSGKFMSVVNKFINFMKVADDQDQEMDTGYMPDLDDDEPMFSRNKRRAEADFGDRARNQEDDEYFEEPAAAPAKNSLFGGIRTRTNSRREESARMIPTGDPGVEVHVFKPTNLDEARNVTDTLLQGQSAVLNLEGLDLMMAQRIIDFVGGSNYAIKGHFTRISSYIFLFTPKDVDIAGDIPEEAMAASASAGDEALNIPYDQRI